MMDWDDVDWSDLIPRLLLYTKGRADRCTWQGRRSGKLPGGRELCDIVQTAIQKTIAGDRIWKSKDCSLFQHLRGAIDSEINHLAEGLENRSHHVGDDSIADISSHKPSPEETVLWIKEERHLLDFLHKRNEQCFSIAHAMIKKNLSGSIEISEELSLSVKDVNNIKKKLRRLISEYINSEKKNAI